MGQRPTRGDKATITPEFVNRVERFSKRKRGVTAYGCETVHTFDNGSDIYMVCEWQLLNNFLSNLGKRTDITSSLN